MPPEDSLIARDWLTVSDHRAAAHAAPAGAIAAGGFMAVRAVRDKGHGRL